MAVLSVRKYGDPVLRRRAKPVETVTPEIKRMIADMVDTMYDEVGLGLAAPQVGISLRLMVVGDDDGREARALVNPVIAEQGGEIVAEEGCLSIPGVFAPVKRAQTDWLVEKATELGAYRLVPVITRRTIVERVKLERLEAIAIEAAEQCGRTAIPEIADPRPLDRFLAEASGRPLYFADEAGGTAARQAFKPGPATILVGPEGGFTDDERALVRAADGAVPVSLGPRILRAETAALAALAAYMAVAGDWAP